MITVCCRFAHCFKIMRIPHPVWTEVIFPSPDQAICSGRGGKREVVYIRCIDGREPEAYKLWDFVEERICKVHPYAWVQISEDVIEDTFYFHFFNARQIQIHFLGCRAVNGSVRWLDVPRPFSETGSLTAAWTENTFVNYWGTNPTMITNRPIRRRAVESASVNFHTLACRANHKHLRLICVERREAIEKELQARIL